LTAFTTIPTRTMAINLTTDSAEEPIVPPAVLPAPPDTPTLPQEAAGASAVPSPTPEQQAEQEKEVWVYPTHNDEGISYTYQCRGVPQLESWMEQVIYTRRFPYRNKRDIMRHAIYRHMFWLQDHPGCPHAPGTVQLELMRVLQEEEHSQQFLYMERKFDKLLTRALDEGNPVAAQRLAKQLWRAIQQLEQGPWRDHFVKSFKSKYARYLR
jgi:hypothetical protein